VDINVLFTPNEKVKGDLSVVIDVLRATSVITTLINFGCKKIIPVRTVEEALNIKEKNPEYILAGERNSKKVEGFDYGNSPLEYDSKLKGKTVIFTTTNGTKSIIQSRNASLVIIASLLNVNAIIDKINKSTFKKVNIVCSGSNGQISIEDIYCAGMIVSYVNGNLSEKSLLASALYLHYKHSPEKILSEVSSHGRKLVHSGLADDIVFCAKMNLYDNIPYYRNGVIQELRQ
jgi:2-phosphosulfolactate phosphatase